MKAQRIVTFSKVIITAFQSVFSPFVWYNNTHLKEKVDHMAKIRTQIFF